MSDAEETPVSNEAPKSPDDEAISEKQRYFESLRNWLHQIHVAQTSAYMPYYFMAYQMLFNFQSSGTGPFLNNNYQHQGQWAFPPFLQNYQNIRPPQNQNMPMNNNVGTNFGGNMDQNNRPEGIEYVVPPIWKRCIAELLDFFFIFLSKVMFYYITDDYLGILDFKKYSVFHTMNLLKQVSEDYDFALEVTSEIFMLELLNRLGSCFFETLFLSDSLSGPPWGATPGKLIMGLRVVSATNIVPVDNLQRTIVIVYPGTNLSFKTAFIRSAIKNVLITLIFPMCMLTFFFPYNRTSYDVLANTIVVESSIYQVHRRP